MEIKEECKFLVIVIYLLPVIIEMLEDTMLQLQIVNLLVTFHFT